MYKKPLYKKVLTDYLEVPLMREMLFVTQIYTERQKS